MGVADGFTETADIYAPGHASLADGNLVPTAVTLSALAEHCNIHRNTQRAMEQAMALGVWNGQAAEMFLAVESASKVGDRYVVADELGDFWVIAARPSVRNRFPETAHVKCLLVRIPPGAKPDGLP